MTHAAKFIKLWGGNPKLLRLETPKDLQRCGPLKQRVLQYVFKKKTISTTTLVGDGRIYLGAHYMLITEASAKRGALFFMKVTALLCQSLGKGKE